MDIDWLAGSTLAAATIACELCTTVTQLRQLDAVIQLPC